MIAFNRILVLPFEDPNEYNDTAKTAPVSGVVVDCPRYVSKTDGPDDFSERVYPGETVWFSPLAERWNDFLFVDYDQLFAVERNGLIPIGDHTIVKFYEQQPFVGQNTRTNLVRTISTGKEHKGDNRPLEHFGDMYIKGGKKLEMENKHGHDEDHGYFLIRRSDPVIWKSKQKVVTCASKTVSKLL